ncbi:MAG TPA: hypothetical protein DEO85_11920 [Maritimibacter sp.]|nr:hypothetical protein [Maritimibacter sp.]
MSARLDIRPYAAEPGLMVWAHWGTSDRLTVCFSGIGANDDAVQPYEFADTATNAGSDHALFISDTTRSWFNLPGLIEQVAGIVERFAAAVGARIVGTLGHSMGGHMAMLLPAFTRVDTAVGFSPQVSVHPDVVGDDTRWMQYRDKITSFRFRNVMDHLVPETRYIAMHGHHPRESYQCDRFEVRENMTHIIFPKVTHEVPQKLREQGNMRQVVWACFNGRNRRLRELLAPLNVSFRQPGETPVMPPSALIAAEGASQRLS